MSDQANIPDILPNRLNFDAVVFCGCTMKEMQTIALVSLISCMVGCSLLAKIFFGLFLIGVGLAFPMTVAMSWCLALVLQRYKQGKPPGFTKQQAIMTLSRYGLAKSPYITDSIKWSLGRRF